MQILRSITEIRMKRTSLGVLLLAALASPVQSEEQSRRAPTGWMAGLHDDLGLDPQQETIWRDVEMRIAHMPTEQHRDLADLREAAQEELDKPSPDIGRLIALHQGMRVRWAAASYGVEAARLRLFCRLRSGHW